jgi:hypothetical protein
MIESDVSNHEPSDINQSKNSSKLFAYCIRQLRPASIRHGVLITVFALLFTFMLVNGFVLSTWNVDSFVFGKRLILIITCAYILAFCVFWILLSLLAKWAIKPAPDTLRRVNDRRLLSNYFSRLNDRKFFVNVFLILLIPKILIWIAYGANISADSFDTIQSAAGIIPLNAQRPIVNVLALRPFLELGKLLGNFSAGIYIWTLFQSIVFTTCFTYVILFLRQINARPIIQILSAVVFSAMPIFAVAGIIVWSDILFSSFAVLFAILSYKLIKNPQAFCSSKSSVMGFILIAFLFATWRNNGYYAFIIAIPFLIIALRKYWRRFVPLAAVPLIITTGYYQILIPAIVSRQVPGDESLSVPLQQIARCVYEHGDEMSLERIATINHFFSFDETATLYNPIISDPIKSNFRTRGSNNYLKEHPTEFIMLWLETLRDYPITSLNATLYNTKGFWYLFDSYKGVSTDRIVWSTRPEANFEESYQSEYNTNLAEQFQASKRSQLFEIYKNHLFPALMVIDCTPIYFWLFVLCIFVLLIRRDRKTLVTLAGIFGVIVTALAGPVSEPRYLFCLPLIAPVLFAFIFNRPPTDTEAAIAEP